MAGRIARAIAGEESDWLIHIGLAVSYRIGKNCAS